MSGVVWENFQEGIIFHGRSVRGMSAGQELTRVGIQISPAGLLVSIRSAVHYFVLSDVRVKRGFQLYATHATYARSGQ